MSDKYEAASARFYVLLFVALAMFFAGTMLGWLGTQDPEGFTCTARDLPTGQCQTWERDQ